MRKILLALVLLVFTAWAANVKLYLKDGAYHIVREYQVQSDRVHFYSIEREEWEDIPLDLVDVKRTESEAAARKETLEHDAKVLADEDAADRAIKKETSRIPQNPGVYWLDGDKTKSLKAAEGAVHSDKRREILKALSPIPTISGKATLEIDGAHSQNVFSNPEQEFYIQLSETERFGICKVTTKGTIRIVENLTYMPITKDVEEEPVMVEIFRQQLDPNGLYKIWPKEKMAPGEYAVIEYTDGKVNIQIWDFAIK
ncbi:conserved exported hypothetical protein [Candidatus Sulfopaludibacter sp. SbA3]|nr:conserved exported hypothetical protein [Candidatus Sulfopaludibacter sp. SbA3]